MKTLVDTSVLLGPAERADDEEWAVSVVSVGELEAGVLMAGDPATRAARLAQLAELLAEANVLPVDRVVSARYGELRAKSGRIASNDLWIAATALAHDLVLVTADAAQARLPLIRSSLAH